MSNLPWGFPVPSLWGLRLQVIDKFAQDLHGFWIPRLLALTFEYQALYLLSHLPHHLKNSSEYYWLWRTESESVPDQKGAKLSVVKYPAQLHCLPSWAVAGDTAFQKIVVTTVVLGSQPTQTTRSTVPETIMATVMIGWVLHGEVYCLHWLKSAANESKVLLQGPQIRRLTAFPLQESLRPSWCILCFVSSATPLSSNPWHFRHWSQLDHVYSSWASDACFIYVA